MFDKIPTFLLRLVMRIGDKWLWFGRKLNSYAINSVVNISRHRPHPWTTAHKYVSWTSLSDQRFSARHLPTPDRPSQNLPLSQDLAAMFKQPLGKQVLSKKSTLLFPAFAQYLTDGFIRTRMPDPTAGETEEVRLQNTSNQQIDMCPLYGRLRAHTDALRLKSEASGQRGRLKSQVLNGEEYAPFLFEGENIKAEFADLDPPLGLKEILAIMPDPVPVRAQIFAFGGDRTNSSPQVSMMNTLFLREHNRLAGDIEASHPGWDDERVFQTARNTLIVLFLKIVVDEYINHISPHFRFRVDPPVAWDAPWNKPNWVTTEFSLLYRWHSLIPNSIVWAGESVPLMLTLFNNRLLFDKGLGDAFVGVSSQPAGRLGAFNTPDPILHLEPAAIKQGRLCELAPYADYREYVKLPRPKNFADVSSDKDVVDFLAQHYTSVDDVDFYVGLFAEDPVENSPLPPLLLRMVAVDAFSQALTNPLLSRHVFTESTFSESGWRAISTTKSLRDVLVRNLPGTVGGAAISMTQATWRPV
jgi:prostaglandin-endoperoxide synthase 2